MTALAEDIWKRLHHLGDRGTAITLQCVPGHAGLDGNEDADRLAGEAAAVDQPDFPIDLASARIAIGRPIGVMVDVRARASHLYSALTPGHSDLSLWEACTPSQLRTGTSPLSRDVAQRLGLAADAACPACGEPDSAAHLLTDSPAYEAAPRRRWGPDPLWRTSSADRRHWWWSPSGRSDESTLQTTHSVRVDLDPDPPEGGRAGQGGLQPFTGDSPCGRPQPHEGSRPRRLQGLAGQLAWQPIQAHHEGPVPEAGPQHRSGRCDQRSPTQGRTLGVNTELPPPDRPPPDPRLPAVRRPDMPGGTVRGVPRRGGRASTRAAEVPLPGRNTFTPIREHTPRPDAAARRWGRGGLGPRLPTPPSALGLRPALGRPVEKKKNNNNHPVDPPAPPSP